MESHTSFGRVENKYPFGPNVERLHFIHNLSLVNFTVTYISFNYRSELDEKLKTYNKYYEGGSGEIRSREVNIILYTVKELKIRQN